MIIYIENSEETVEKNKTPRTIKWIQQCQRIQDEHKKFNYSYITAMNIWTREIKITIAITLEQPKKKKNHSEYLGVTLTNMY